jgi:hypothetical protein
MSDVRLAILTSRLLALSSIAGLSAIVALTAATGLSADDENTIHALDGITAKAGDKQATLPIVSRCGGHAAPTGTWHSDFGDVTFPDRSAGNVTAPYDHNNGRISGALNGRIYKGTWIQDGSDTPCPTERNGSKFWGDVELRFNAAFDRFNGRWNYCGTTPFEERSWSGYRNCRDGCAGESRVVAGKLVCPEKLPESGRLPPGTGWIHELADEKWEEARKADCSCKTVTLGYVRTRLYNENNSRFTTAIAYDFWDRKKTPESGSFTIPMLSWHRGRTFPLPTHRPDRVCFQFTFPKALALLRRVEKGHHCDVQVKLHYPRQIAGKSRPYTIVQKLYSVTGTGGTSTMAFGLSGGTDGRSILANQICVAPINQYWSVGPSGATGYVEWTVRGARELQNSPLPETCPTVSFTIK